MTFQHRDSENRKVSAVDWEYLQVQPEDPEHEDLKISGQEKVVVE